MKTYRCYAYGFDVFIEGPGSDQLGKLNPRLDLSNHSPAGFAWGYGGSGPAQLALALLADALGDDEAALRYHQDFKFRVIGRLEQNKPWTLTEQQIRDQFNSLPKREKVEGEEWGA